MSERPKFRSKELKAGLMLTLGLMGVNYTGANSAAAHPGCNTASKIAEIARHVKNQDTFHWKAMVSNKKNGLVLIEPKHDNSLNVIANPLVITCGKKVVRYVGITTDSHDLPGKTYPVEGTDLFLKVAKPDRVHVDIDPGTAVIKHFDIQEQIVHPTGEPVSVPGFVPQPAPTSEEKIADSALGLMLNGL